MARRADVSDPGRRAFLGAAAVGTGAVLAGVTVTFEPVNGGSAGIDQAWEGRFEGGAWLPGRLLNGDQTHQGRHIALYAGEWKIQKLRLYTYR